MQHKDKSSVEKALVLLIVFTLVFIWGNSMLNKEMSAGVSQGLLSYIRPLLEALGIETESDHWLRKLAHFCEFALLGAEMSALSVLKEKRRFSDFAMCALYCLLVAMADETIQYFSGRYPHILDVLLDFSGSICGIAFLGIVFISVKKYKRKAA